MIIGHNALQIPSNAAVAVLITLRCHPAIAITTVIANAIRHALYPGNFRILIATINQMMGSNARMNLINI